MGKKNIKVTLHGAPRKRKTYIQWSADWFSKGIVTTLLSLPQCHAAFGTIPSTLAWVDRAPLASMCRCNPHQSIQSTTVTASHVTWGRVEYESTIPRGTDEGLDLWEAILILISHLNLQMELYKNSVVFLLILALLMFVSKIGGGGRFRPRFSVEKPVCIVQ
jgi:hypothetical protein